MMWMEGGVVFWVIVLIGALALLVFFERLLNLRRARIDYRDFIKGVCNVLEKGNTDEALMLCEETPGPVSAVVDAAVTHRNESHETLRDVVGTTGHAQLSLLERRLVFLSLSCEIAPLCGLFGAVLSALQIAQTLTAQSQVVVTTDLSGGLTRAILCVLAGILVSIECHVLYAMLMSRIERIALEIDAGAAEILAFLTRTVPAQLTGLTADEIKGL
ncbi:MAG: MotA/TolQ/ExbB proton channel family protein [Kiritimatiellae bacterium]|nr:MotA/TolQ/ExbB proton channel family protein [Kiritimatiellia bacterium]